MPLTQYLGSAGFVGVGVETTPGTPVAASSYVQLLDEAIAREPGIVLEKLLRASRDSAFVPVLGQQKAGGTITTPLYIDQGLALLTAAVGADAYQYSSGATSEQAIGGSGIAVGVGSFSLATLPGGLVVGDYVQLQQVSGGPAVTNLSELHSVASITGTGPYTIGIGSELTQRPYPASGAVWRVPASTAVFTHVLLPDLPLPSFYKTLTIEKSLGGLTSLQYAGAVVGKASLTLSTKEAAKVGYTISALAEASITPTTPSYGTSPPLALPNLSTTFFGAADTSVSAFSLDIDQGAKEYYTFNGGTMPALVTPVERKITGKFTNIVQSIAYHSDAMAGTTGAASVTFTLGASSIVISLPKMVLTKLAEAIKVGDLLMYDAEFQAPYDDVTGHSVQVIVTNGLHLPLA